jgi:hypothetical protein
VFIFLFSVVIVDKDFKEFEDECFEVDHEAELAKEQDHFKKLLLYTYGSHSCYFTHN